MPLQELSLSNQNKLSGVSAFSTGGLIKSSLMSLKAFFASSVYVVPQRSWGDRSDADHSKCLLLGGRRLNLLTIIPKPKGSGGARAATAQIGPANERNKTK